jgi:hypothetical protein
MQRIAACTPSRKQNTRASAAKSTIPVAAVETGNLNSVGMHAEPALQRQFWVRGEERAGTAGNVGRGAACGLARARSAVAAFRPGRKERRRN